MNMQRNNMTSLGGNPHRKIKNTAKDLKLKSEFSNSSNNLEGFMKGEKNVNNAVV